MNSSPRPRGDLGRQTVTILAFGISLGVSAVALPLLALEAGFEVAVVGAFTAASAAAQFGSRLLLPAVLARVADRTLMMGAAGLLLSSFLVLLASVSVGAFVLAQGVQGMGRALFWTANQTHAVRGEGSTTRRLALVQMMGTGGGLVGPVLAGLLIAVSTDTALQAGAGLAGVSMAAGAILDRHAPYQRDPDRVPIWRLEGIGLSAWAGSIGGVWRGILDSFVPALLSAQGMGSATVGALVATADAAAFVVTGAVARWSIDQHITRAVGVAGVAVAAAVACLPLAAGVVPALAVVVVGGAGGGLGLVLAPAAASLVATGGEQGAGIALAGTYRAGARFAAPGAVSVLSTVLPVGTALLVVAAGVATPALAARSRRR